MSREGQYVTRQITVEDAWVSRGLTVRIDNTTVPAHATPLIESDSNLALGDRTGRHIEENRRATPHRNSRGERICRQAAGDSPKRCDEHTGTACVDKTESRLAGLTCHLGPISSATEVSGILQRHDRHAVPGTLFSAESGGLLPHRSTRDRTARRRRPSHCFRARHKR